MTDITFPLWLAVMSLLPYIDPSMKLPRWLALSMLIGMLVGSFAGWYFGLTISVPASIGHPLSIALMIIVIALAGWEFTRSVLRMSRPKTKGEGPRKA